MNEFLSSADDPVVDEAAPFLSSVDDPVVADPPVLPASEDPEATPDQVLSYVHSVGPGAELDYLDEREKSGLSLTFNEWQRREELTSKLTLGDKAVRLADGAVEGAQGLWAKMTGAFDEAMATSRDYDAGRIGAMGVLGKTVATLGEAGAQSLFGFSELITGSIRRASNWLDRLDASGDPEQERQTLAYEHYLEDRYAKAKRDRIQRDGVLATAVSNLEAEFGGVSATDANRTVAVAQESVMPQVAEMTSMVLPTDPMNLIPFGAGAKSAGVVEKAAARATAATGTGLAKASEVVAKATDIGAIAKAVAAKVVPEASEKQLGWVGGLATGGALAPLISGAETAGLSTMSAIYAKSRVALFGAEKAGQIVGTVARAIAEGPRFQSVLQRIARDTATPAWMASAARTLEAMGVSTAADYTSGAAKGAAAGAAFGAGTAVLEGEDAEGIGRAVGAGVATGSVLGAGGKFWSRLTGADRAERVANERMLLRESIRMEDGDAGAAAFDSLPEATQLQAGLIQAVAGPATRVRVLDGEAFAAVAGNRSAGVFLEGTMSANKVPQIVINADSARAKGSTLLHEFAHLLASRQAPGEIKSLVASIYSPEQIAKFGAAYAKTAMEGERRANPAAFEGLSEPEAIAKTMARMERENGPDWVHQEIFAEHGAQALHGADWFAMAKDGENARDIPLRQLSLRTKRAVLEGAGVDFLADGSVQGPELIAKEFQLSEAPRIAETLKSYVKELADFAPRLDTEAKKLKEADAGKGPPIKMGKNFERLREHPAFANSYERNPTTGLLENDWSIINPDGTVTLKSDKAVNAVELARTAAVEALFPPDSPLLARDAALVGRRMRDDGRVEISGTVLPQGFHDSEAFSGRIRETAKKLEDLMNRPEGETLEHWYHQIGSKTKDSTWAAQVRAKLGNVRATAREIRPISFEITQAKNIGVRVIDVAMTNAKMHEWSRAEKLGLWQGNLEAFHTDLKAMMANWATGQPGFQGIGTEKHAALLDFLGKEGGKDSLIKTFRLDRMEDARPTGRGGWTFDYGKYKRRQSPDTTGEPGRSNTGVIVSAKPGMKTGIIYPPQPPNWRELHEALAPVWLKRETREWLGDNFGLDRPQVDIAEGSYEGVRESSFQISGKGLTPEAANDLAKVAGLAFAQDAAIASYPVPDLNAPDIIPGIQIDFTHRLKDAEWTQLATALGSIGDFSGTPDGRGARLLYFGDGDGLASWKQSIDGAVASLTFHRGLSPYLTRSNLFEGSQYADISQTVGGRVRQDGHSAGASGPSDLLGGAFRYLAQPFAEEIGRRGFRIDLPTFLSRHGLGERERPVVENAYGALLK